MERQRAGLSTYLFLIPGVGFIVLFIGSSIFITLTQSFGLFSVTGSSKFTMAHWAGLLGDKESLDSVL